MISDFGLRHSAVPSLAGWSLPSRATVIGSGDVVGPFADDRLQPHRLQVFVGIRLDVQHDVGAGGLARRRAPG